MIKVSLPIKLLGILSLYIGVGSIIGVIAGEIIAKSIKEVSYAISKKTVIKELESL